MRLFDRLAACYDEVVPFFATFGRQMLDWVRLSAGVSKPDPRGAEFWLGHEPA
ncbi:hypothetical protein [Allorhizocola rhizosphaerae]|uniref:hypothetical protein n=1 Tax=Allorhizocola rhizosphaerae TaxID=1872709 RepID=UPI0013C3083D|nr:hypothetical protein [Allorhizocola rhizosphaerae]